MPCVSLLPSCFSCHSATLERAKLLFIVFYSSYLNIVKKMDSGYMNEHYILFQLFYGNVHSVGL